MSPANPKKDQRRRWRVGLIGGGGAVVVTGVQTRRRRKKMGMTMERERKMKKMEWIEMTMLGKKDLLLLWPWPVAA